MFNSQLGDKENDIQIYGQHPKPSLCKYTHSSKISETLQNAMSLWVVLYCVLHDPPPSPFSRPSNRKLESIPSKIPRKKPLGILLRSRPRRLPNCIRRKRCILPPSLKMLINPLLQLEQRLGGCNFETRVSTRIQGRCVVFMFGQRNMHLLARVADVEPYQLVDLCSGDGP